MYTLLTPYLLLTLLLFAVGTFAFKKWKWGIAFLVAAIVVNAVFHCFALHPFKHREGGLKVMCLNIHAADDLETASSIMDLVAAHDPDVFCALELWKGPSNEIDTLLQNRLGYTRDWIRDGIGCYSKYPICNSKNIEPMPLVSVACGSDTLNLVLCHLASNNFIAETMHQAPIDSVHSSTEFRAYLKNISAASRQRHSQAEELCQSLDFNHPTLVLGDMNDLWGSGALRTFQKAGLNDAWWHAGFGYGSTIHHPLPFRIDHILYSPHLKVRTVKSVKTHGLSDHDAVVATFEINQ